MVPQVYLNYKLKSVEHLPWRMLFYRFLNTIIDDLFAFIISMPTMHRLACFRDDIIFIIFLFQMCKYRKRRYRYRRDEEEEKAEANAEIKNEPNQPDENQEHEKTD